MGNKKLPLLVITAPSCAGKDYLTKCLFDQHPDDFAMVVSTTTRPPRAGEINGVDYHFVDKEQFDKLEAEHQLLESVKFGSKCYGTSSVAIDQIQEEGKFPVLIVEPIGAQNIRNWCANNNQPATFIFLKVGREIALERFLSRFINDYSALEREIGNKTIIDNISPENQRLEKERLLNRRTSELVDEYSKRIHISMYKEWNWGNMLNYTYSFGPMVKHQDSIELADFLAGNLRKQAGRKLPLDVPQGQIPVQDNNQDFCLEKKDLYDMPYIIKKTLMMIKDAPVTEIYLKNIILNSETERLNQKSLKM